MKLETERLILRDLDKKDVEDILKNANDLEVSRYLALVPYPYSKKDAEWWANHCIEQSGKEPREDYNLGVEFKGKIVGMIGLTGIDDFTKVASFGLWLGKDSWRNGIMTEAAKLFFDFAFKDLGVRRINSGAYPENKASIELHKKLGFMPEGVKRKHMRSKATGKIHDENQYGLIKEDWEKVRETLI